MNRYDGAAVLIFADGSRVPVAVKLLISELPAGGVTQSTWGGRATPTDDTSLYEHLGEMISVELPTHATGSALIGAVDVGPTVMILGRGPAPF